MFIRCPKSLFMSPSNEVKKCHFHATAIGQCAMPRQVEEPSTLLFFNLIAAQRSTCFTHFPPNADNSQFKLSDLNETALSLECSRLDCFISAAFFLALCDLTWSNHVLEESARWREKKKMKKFVCHSRWHGHDVNRRAAAVVVFSVDFQLQRSWSLCRPNIAIEINMFSPRRALARSRIFFRLT